jgi:tRNA (guanine-N7-)-methyltransferase
MTSEKKQLFFGRLKGRCLRPAPYQRTTERLKNLSIQRWQDQWPKELWLEIGFGSGEHLTQWLTLHPNRSVIGVEVFLNGLVNCMHAMPESLENRCAIFSNPVQELWPLLPESIFDGIILFFPDPWRKRRHHDRRMVQPEFLDLCARFIKPGGHFRFASDYKPLVEHMLRVFHNHPRWKWVDGATKPEPESWPCWPESWPSSRYRDKALAQNIPCAFSLWQETSPQIP